jgi:NitT/TauT family transport system substrate-binding protein
MQSATAPRRSLGFAAAALATAATLVAGACSSTASTAPSASTAASASAAASAAALPTPEAGTFRMGTEPWLGYGQWWIAQDKGLFTKNGIPTTLTNFDTDDQINAALASGQIDGANIATHTALRLKSEGTDLTIVMLLDQSNTADAILAGPGITSIKDLKGKKVAYEEGTTSDILLRYALSQNGMTIDDIVKVPTPANQAGVAVIAKQVDAAVTYEPYLSAAMKQDSTFKLLYTAAEKPGLISDVFVVRTDYIKTHPGQIYGLLRSWNDALAEYNTNTTAAQAIIDKAVGAEPGSEADAFKGVKYYTVDEAKALIAGAYKSTITEVKAIALAAGIMTKPVDETTIIDSTFVNALGK